MTLEKLRKANELRAKLNELNFVLRNDGTNFQDAAGMSIIGKVASSIVKEEFLELLRNKRTELQQQFNDL